MSPTPQWQVQNERIRRPLPSNCRERVSPKGIQQLVPHVFGDVPIRMKTFIPRAEQFTVGLSLALCHKEEGFAEVEHTLHPQAELANRGRVSGLAIQTET